MIAESRAAPRSSQAGIARLGGGDSAGLLVRQAYGKSGKNLEESMFAIGSAAKGAPSIKASGKAPRFVQRQIASAGKRDSMRDPTMKSRFRIHATVTLPPSVRNNRASGCRRGNNKSLEQQINKA